MSLDSIKRRMNSVQSTSKITNAMKLIASSKLSKQTKIFMEKKSYFEEYYEIISTLLSTINENDLKEILPSNNSDKTLWIIVTSNLGLCAGYNVNLYKELNGKININDKLAIFGRKGTEFYKKKFDINNFVDTSYINIESNIDNEMCLILANVIYEKLRNGEISKIKIAYTKFINALTFKPTIVDIFPFEKTELNNQKAKNNLFDFEPNKKDLLLSLIPEYISTIIFAALVESVLSESASRRNAMDTATTNANELIDKFRLQYNRLRQAGITNQIIEIVAGKKEDE